MAALLEAIRDKTRIEALEARVEELEDKFDPDRKKPIVLECDAFPIRADWRFSEFGTRDIACAEVRTKFGTLNLEGIPGEQARLIGKHSTRHKWRMRLEFTPIA